MLGYQSVDDFYDTNSIMVDAKTLFPKGMINLSAIKPYSDFKIDDAILLAASLTIHAGSILSDMFSSMVAGDNQMLFPVENLVYEDSMGICGWINNKRVLLGNRALMTSHDIEGIPSKTKEFEYTQNGKDALYLSVSGNLSAMFIIEVNANNEIKYWLKELQKEGIYLIIKSIDSVISLTRISRLFKISEDMIKILPSRMHKLFDSETSSMKTQNASMACNGKFSNFANLLISTNKIRQTALLGTILQATSAILGFSIVTVFMLMKAYWQINVSTLIFYNLFWGLISVGVVKLRKI
jgi:Cu+-exporting ATPase